MLYDIVRASEEAPTVGVLVIIIVLTSRSAIRSGGGGGSDCSAVLLVHALADA